MSNLIYLETDYAVSSAWVTEIPYRKHSMFHVLFENEYENIFFIDVESGRWVEEDLGFTQLAVNVGEAIKHFLRSPIHVPKILTWHKCILGRKVIHFGFLPYYNGNYKLYDIYGASMKFMYTLMEIDKLEWQLVGTNNINENEFDVEMAQKIVQVLSMYSFNPHL